MYHFPKLLTKLTSGELDPSSSLNNIWMSLIPNRGQDQGSGGGGAHLMSGLVAGSTGTGTVDTAMTVVVTTRPHAAGTGRGQGPR
jgi:hypothetical protein